MNMQALTADALSSETRHQVIEHDITDADISAIRSASDSLSKGNRLDQILPPDKIQRLRDVAELHIPRNLREAVAVIDILSLTYSQFRKCIKTLNVLHASNLRNLILREIIATKLVQRRLCLKTVFECSEDIDFSQPHRRTDQHHRLRRIPSTAVKDRSYNLSPNRVHWLDGDMPLYDANGDVVPGHPILPDAPDVDPYSNEYPFQGASSRDHGSSHDLTFPDDDSGLDEDTIDRFQNAIHEFEPEEYCRLLHSLADKSMVRYLNSLVDPDLKHQPWEEHVAPLFNNKKFNPKPVRSLSGGVSKHDIQGLRPTFKRPRDGETLQQKFAEFKSLYRAAVRSYVQWGNDDTETFSDFCQGRQYVMYAFCLLENFPKLEPITLKNPSHKKTPESSEASTGASAWAKNKRSAPTEEIDIDGVVSSAPTQKRVKAAILGGREREELKKIIEGGIPEDVSAIQGVEGITSSPVEGLTKSEAVQQVERAEREHENMQHLITRRMIENRDDKQGPSLLISRPRSAALEDIEMYAKERALVEVKNARATYTSSLLVALQQARHAIDDIQRDSEERRLLIDVRDNLLRKLAENNISV